MTLHLTFVLQHGIWRLTLTALFFCDNSCSIMELIYELLNKMRAAEVLKLKKRLGEQKTKIRFIDAVSNYKKDIDNLELLTDLGYEDNRQAFYTLKHRLLEDILSQKLEQGKSPITDVQEKANNLRVLLYSEDYGLLEKNLKQLERKVIELELYSAAVEVYFCYYLLHYNDPKKRRYYQQKVEESQNNYALYSTLEITFYEMVFQSLDVFYHSIPKVETQLKAHLEESSIAHNKLHSNISLFFWLSSKLTIELAPKKEINPSHLTDSKRLLDLFENSSVKYRYPGCSFAINCLTNRYHYLADNKKEFKQSLTYLSKHVNEIKGYRMYENVYFYYLYINILYLVEEGKYQLIQPFVEANLSYDSIEYSSKKIQFYYYYIIALGHYYNNDFSKAHSALLKARELKHVIESSNSWIYIENQALTIVIQLIYEHSNTFDYEMKSFKKFLIKHQTYSPVWKTFAQMTTAYYKGNFKKAAALKDVLAEQKREFGVLKLIDIAYAHDKIIASENVSFRS